MYTCYLCKGVNVPMTHWGQSEAIDIWPINRSAACNICISNLAHRPKTEVEVYCGALLKCTAVLCWLALWCSVEVHCGALLTCTVVLCWLALWCSVDLHCGALLTCTVVLCWSALWCSVDLHCGALLTCTVVLCWCALWCSVEVHFGALLVWYICWSVHSVYVEIWKREYHIR